MEIYLYSAVFTLCVTQLLSLYTEFSLALPILAGYTHHHTGGEYKKIKKIYNIYTVFIQQFIFRWKKKT